MKKYFLSFYYYVDAESKEPTKKSRLRSTTCFTSKSTRSIGNKEIV